MKTVIILASTLALLAAGVAEATIRPVAPPRHPEHQASHRITKPIRRLPHLHHHHHRQR